MIRRRAAGVVVAAVLASSAAGLARGEAAPAGAEGAHDETSALFAEATRALREGRPGDAIADLEALGDRGLIDPVASLDRGLAYAERVRSGAAMPGDLGRAALAFEEARALTRDPSLAADATRALGAVRAEVARRRALAGDPVDVDPGVPLGRAVVGLASEDVWSAIALFASAFLTAALSLRWRATARRVRLGSAIAIAVSAPILLLTAVLAVAARDQRLHLREGIIVSESARLSDERHITLPGAAPLPEAARVTIEDAAALERGLAGWTRVRFGPKEGWIPSPAVRPLAHAD